VSSDPIGFIARDDNLHSPTSQTRDAPRQSLAHARPSAFADMLPRGHMCANVQIVSPELLKLLRIATAIRD
jgi:hypothetical protein